MRRLVLVMTSTMVLLGMLTLAYVFQPTRSEPVLIVVPDNYPTIQDAINAATLGDIIFVKNGTYYEHLVVNKSISLIGENWEATIIDGNYVGTVVKVTVDNVTITGFTIRNSGGYPERGVALNQAKNCIVYRNKVAAKRGVGIRLFSSSNNSITGNDMTKNYAYAIVVSFSSNNLIAENNITDNKDGIRLSSSSNNNITGNNITKNRGDGILLDCSSNNVLRNNVMVGNYRNFGVTGDELPDFINDVDTSNMVDEETILYLVNEQNLIIDPQTHPNIGYLAVVNSTNITLRHLSMKNNGVGLLFAYTNNSLVHNVTFTNNIYGAWLLTSSNNTMIGNTIANNSCGIQLYMSSNNNSIYGNKITTSNWLEWCIVIYSSSNNRIIGNNITASKGTGILLYSSLDNTITRNNIANNERGIDIYSSSNNRIFHNNFMDNARHAFLGGYWGPNLWDDGYPSGGNYWSNYNGPDVNHDGVGDTPCIIDTSIIDNYPLMGMFSDFNATPERNVQIMCNSTVSDFRFNGTAIRFNVTGKDGTVGFCRICIPTALMNRTYKILVNDTEVPYTILQSSNMTHIYLYFTYNHSTKEVIIIPEFPSLSILPLLFMTSILLAIAYQRKYHA